MTQASIGHQCPECVAGNKQQVYTARNLPRTQAYVMVTLIAINVVVFLGQQATSGPAVLTSLGSRGLLNGSRVADGEWYRIISFGFFQYSMWNLLLTCWALWAIGRSLEVEIGRIQVGLVTLAAILGGAVSVLTFDWFTVAAAATAPALGLCMALIAILRAEGASLNRHPVVLISILCVVGPFLSFAGLLFGVAASFSPFGHVGSAAAGLAAGALIGYGPRLTQSKGLVTVGLAGLCIVLAASAVAVANLAAPAGF